MRRLLARPPCQRPFFFCQPAIVIKQMASSSDINWKRWQQTKMKGRNVVSSLARVDDNRGLTGLCFPLTRKMVNSGEEAGGADDLDKSLSCLTRTYLISCSSFPTVAWTGLKFFQHAPNGILKLAATNVCATCFQSKYFFDSN